MSLDNEHPRGGVGRTEGMDDLATLRGLTAPLDRDNPPRVDNAIPPSSWDWLYYLPI